MCLIQENKSGLKSHRATLYVPKYYYLTKEYLMRFTKPRALSSATKETNSVLSETGQSTQKQRFSTYVSI